MERFLLVTDTPGIKHFVFGTDALAEIRGASALLDRLNRQETERVLRANLSGGTLEVVFANGGSGQFVLHAADREAAESAVTVLARHYRHQTGGDARLVWGLVPWPESLSYQEASRQAHRQLRCWRETASANRCAPLWPLLAECSSASHLPAQTSNYNWGGESLMLSEAARCKRDELSQIWRNGIWHGWMDYLGNTNDWPDEQAWSKLRPKDSSDFEDLRVQRVRGPRRNYVGLVYADGNAMGRLVQELDSVATCRTFSSIVDNSIRQACYAALTTVCQAEIQAFREGSRKPLPADILLLGGDDLLVLLPADLALPFALEVTKRFEDLTQQQIAKLTGEPARFFQSKLQGKGMTISCGVSFARAGYPFYLLLDLAEDLLKSAKKAGSSDPRCGNYHAPTYIDFHLVVGGHSADLSAVRRNDYHVGLEGTPARTLRPYSREDLVKLRECVERLQKAQIPRSKLHDLWEAVLDARSVRAEDRCRELFSRLRQTGQRQERSTLWSVLQKLGMEQNFPWCRHNNKPATALADLIEAHDLFTPQEAS
jgi:hypothetical protein